MLRQGERVEPPKQSTATKAKTNVPGLYSCSGFDMIGVLAKVATRPNPLVSIGPVDMSCSFVVSDARKPDHPIVYISDTFEKLTGYTAAECVGKNCRFLQSPDGFVNEGSYRRYTDNATVYSLKKSIAEFKECQYTLINYRKGGEPFINLITIIPISWENPDEIAYFVGFQVDLVEQPNSIMNRMKDGTYVVNYQIADVPINTPRASMSDARDTMGSDLCKPSLTAHGSTFAVDLTQLIGTADQTEAEDIFYRSLIEQIDFAHVLSLRGVFLYVSPDCRRLLEYDEDELIGHSLSEFCHPGDLVSVMRELKDSSNGMSTVNIVYRIRRKHSGYIWVEVSGKCSQGEKSKGKKFVVLTGRERPVSKLHKLDLDRVGGVSESDIWSKLSLEGLYLNCSSDAIPMLGFTPAELLGRSLLDFVHGDDVTELQNALNQISSGKIVRLQHRLKNKKGEYLIVNSTFFPGNGDGSESSPIKFILHKCNDIIESVNYDPNNPNAAVNGPANGISAKRVYPVTSIDKDHDDLFEVLSPVRCTSWQYELHQLRMQNRRLKNELEELDTALTSRNHKKRRQQS